MNLQDSLALKSGEHDMLKGQFTALDTKHKVHVDKYNALNDQHNQLKNKSAENQSLNDSQLNEWMKKHESLKDKVAN